MPATTFGAVWSALGATVVHFLWQGTLVGLLAAAVLGCLRNRSAEARYAVASSAMLLSVAAFVATFLTILRAPSSEGLLPIALAGTGFTVELATSLRAPTVAAWCWTVGACAMSLRCASNGCGARRLRTVAVAEPDASWQRAFLSLKAELGIERAVRLFRSGLAEVPMVVGWFSPIVLVPAAAFTALGPDQLKALLAHELAHIRRHDHLLNAAQAVVEIVLFFHPAVWWLSKQMRVEREFCCDETSVRATGNPRLLAEALARMESLRGAGPRTAVLASNGGPLVQRIQRILGVRPDGRRSLLAWQLPVGLVLTGVLAAAGTTFAAPALERKDATQHAGERKPVQERADVEAVEQRVRAAVESGDMTREQAARILEELRARKAAGRDGRGGDERRASEAARRRAAEEKYSVMEARLNQAVATGRLTREDADKKLAELRKGLARGPESRSGAGANDARFKEHLRTIEAAVAAGKLTPEEARKKLHAARAKLAASDTSFERFADTDSGLQRKSIDVEGAQRRIDAAVAAGELTPAQGAARLAALKQSLRQRESAPRKDTFDDVKRNVDAAVKAGKLTPEQARERLAAWKQSVAERTAGVREARTVESVAEELQELVETGRVTQEQADARLAGFKRAQAERAARGDAAGRR